MVETEVISERFPHQHRNGFECCAGIAAKVIGNRGGICGITGLKLGVGHLRVIGQNKREEGVFLVVMENDIASGHRPSRRVPAMSAQEGIETLSVPLLVHHAIHEGT